MNERFEQASADLREAEAAVANYVPLEDLQKSVEIAEAAVLAAARASTPRASAAMLAEMPTKDDPVTKPDEMLTGLAAEIASDETFSADEVETEECVDEVEAVAETVELEGPDEVIFEESNLSEVSATAADVVNTVQEAASSDTIDATEEVTVEEAVEASEPTNPNGQLGKNWPQSAA